MEATRPTSARALAALTIVCGVALLLAAHVAWSNATAAPGERRFSPARVAAAMTLAGALAAAAHAAILGVAMPLLYRPRATYAAFGIVGGVLAAIAGVASAALFASV